MTLQEALYKAVHEFGKDVLTEPRLLNILNDYHGFDEMPAARIILKTMQSDGCISQIVGDVDLSKTQNSRISTRLNRLFGFDLTLVEQIINNLCFAKHSCHLNISTEVTDEDLVNGVKDEYGAIYSKDGKRLLKGIDIESYRIRPGTQVVGNEAFKYCQSLKSVIISDSVTHIGDWAFQWCNSLASINIPDSVTHIGKAAFSDCMGLKSIIIPDSVSHIGKAAFFECSALREITIHNSVTHIGERVLDECEHLTSIIIPNESKQRFLELLNAYSDKLIEQDDWEHTLSTEVTEEDLANGIIDEYGALYSSDEKRLLRGVQNTFYNNIKIGTLVICDKAFFFNSMCYFSSINIPDSVTHIGKEAFSGSQDLTSITIPKSVTHIGYNAFSGCSILSSIQVSRDNRTYDSRENCNAIIHTATNTLIAGCENTIIPKSVTHIGHYAFWGCTGLSNFTLPNSVTHIGNGAFRDCRALKSVTLPNSVAHIGDGAFYFCWALKSVTLPNSVTYIGKKAFYYCCALTSITILESVTHIGNDAFSFCSHLASITIPNSVVHLGKDVFKGCDALTKIHIPAGSYNKFKNLLPGFEDKLCESSILTVSDEDLLNGVKDQYGAHYSSDGKRLLRGINISSYCIKPGTQVICDRAFDNCYSLTNITIPDTVTHIGVGAFRDCLRLSNVSLPEGIMLLGKCAFTNCVSLRSIRLPKQISQIREETFSRCRSLQKVIIEEGMKRIGENAFTWCASLKSVELPSTLIYVGKGAFDWTPISLKIKIPTESRKRYEHLMSQYKDRLITNKQRWFSKLLP